MADKKNKATDQKAEKGYVPLKLPPLIDISRVDHTRSELLRLLDSPKNEIVVDGSAVERITTPGVQLLLSLEKTLAQRGEKKLVLANPSGALRDACAALGLSHKLQEWSAV
ncbi:MAG: STAS domain-containing protein [Alphaproteobacteria bacterium]|nr:STAS domain-containing protein [Alphaproteobacteria bacterium]